MNDSSNIEFVAVPVIADMPEYGWHIVSKTEFDSKGKAIRVIKKLNEIQLERNEK